MADKVKVSVLEENGTELFVPTERLLTSDIVDFDSSTAGISSNPDNVESAILDHGERHRPDSGDGLATASGVTVSTNGTNAEGNANSFARSNHTHKTEVYFEDAQASGTISTTSTTDVLIPGMTLTPPAGTYLVSFDISVQRSRNDGQGFISVYIGGTQEAASERRFQTGKGGGGRNTIGVMSISEFPVTVNGSQAIEIRWRRAGGGGSLTGYVGRSLTVKRVD